jgi:hypothetical protein
MFVDEKRNFPLTKYATTKGIKKIVKSDHNIMNAKFSIQYRNEGWKRPRKEVFNLKNPECQAKLRKCFNESLSFSDQCNRFFKSLDDILHQCFRKIKVGKHFSNKEIENLLTQQSKLKIFLSKNLGEKAKSEAEAKLGLIEEQISSLSSARNMKTVQGHIQSIRANGGRFSQTGMWRLKNKLWPKEQDPPMAKCDEKGNLISAPSALKQLYLQHYVKKLEHRKIKEDYLEN